MCKKIDNILGKIRNLDNYQEFFSDVNKGICKALTFLWFQAVFCDQINNFTNRLSFIFKTQNLNQYLYGLKEKVKKRESLTENEKSHLEILPFADVILLQQYPEKTPFAEQIKNHFDALRIHQPYGFSIDIKLFIQYPLVYYPVIYPRNSLISFINNMLHHLSTQFNTHPFCMSITTIDHIVGIAWLNNKFHFFDQNDLRLTTNDPYTSLDRFMHNIILEQVLDQYLDEEYFLPIDIEILYNNKSYPTTRLGVIKTSIDDQYKIYRQSFDNEAKLSNLFLAACIFNYYELSRSLMTTFQTLDENGLAPLHNILTLGYVDCLISFLDNFAPDVNQPDRNGLTPLHHAVIAKDFEAIKILFTKGAQINQPDNKGQTPLHYAAIYGDACLIVQLTINEYINVNLKDYEGLTPLHHAVLRNDFSVVSQLIYIGADVTIKDKYDRTPDQLTLNPNILRIIYHPDIYKRDRAKDEEFIRKITSC